MINITDGRPNCNDCGQSLEDDGRCGCPAHDAPAWMLGTLLLILSVFAIFYS